MMRLRLGKLAGSGGVPRGVLADDESMRGNAMGQVQVLARIHAVESGAPTAMVAAMVPALVAASSAPSCAAASTSASPDTMVRPAPHNARAKRRAFSAPWAVGLRLPTTAGQRSLGKAGAPAATPGPWYSNSGGSSVSSRAWG